MLRRAALNQAVLTWVLALPVLIGLAVAVRGGPVVLDAIDPAAAAARSGLLDGALDAVDFVGSLPVWGAVVAALSLVAARTSLGRGAEVLVVAVAAEAAATAIKALVGRARPAGADIPDLLVAAGFPSGHVTRTAVLVGVLFVAVPAARRRPRLVLTFGLTAVAVMGVARVSSSSHYTSDVIGALLLAALILAAWHVWRAAADEAERGLRPAGDRDTFEPWLKCSLRRSTPTAARSIVSTPTLSARCSDGRSAPTGRLGSPTCSGRSPIRHARGSCTCSRSAKGRCACATSLSSWG